MDYDKIAGQMKEFECPDTVAFKFVKANRVLFMDTFGDGALMEKDGDLFVVSYIDAFGEEQVHRLDELADAVDFIVANFKDLEYWRREDLEKWRSGNND